MAKEWKVRVCCHLFVLMIVWGLVGSVTTPSLATTSPATCSSFAITSCPEDIHHMVSSAFIEGVSVSWATPTYEALDCEVRVDPTHTPGDIFVIGISEVSYSFEESLSGENLAFCNFTINVIEAQCEEDEYKCFRSGRCIPKSGGSNGLGQVCDSFPDCPDNSDEEYNDGCFEFSRPCSEYNSARSQLLESCSSETSLRANDSDYKSFQEEPIPGDWIFHTDQKQNTFLFRVGIRIFDLGEYIGLLPDGPSAEYEIQITTSKTAHNLTLYLSTIPGDELLENGLIYRSLRSPLELSPNEEITISLSYTPDSLNEPSTPVYLNFFCFECVEVDTLTFVGIDCEDSETKTCLNNFYFWNVTKTDSVFCGTEEDAKFYRSLYDNQCLVAPEIVHIDSDQRALPGSTLQLHCAVSGYPPPLISWLDESLQTVTEDSQMVAVLTVSVTEVDASYFCKYNNSLGSGISQAVLVQPLPEFCGLHNQMEVDVLQGEAGTTCSRGNDIRGFPFFGGDTNPASIAFSFYFYKDSFSQGAVAYAVSVSVEFFSELLLLSLTNSPVSSFTLTIREQLEEPRRKRAIDQVLYSKRYDNVFVLPSDPFVIFPLDSPVHVGAFEFSNIEVHILPNEWRLPQFAELPGDCYFNITECVDAEFAQGELGINCDDFFQEWTVLIEESKQCESRIDVYEAYQTCIGEADAAPIVRYEPKSQLVSLNGDVELKCSIDHAVRLLWLRQEKVRSQPLDSGNVLQFVEFEPFEQGEYLCVGYGGGVYSETIVETAPALLVIEGAATFVVSIHFPEFEYQEELQESLQSGSGLGAQIAISLQDWFQNIFSFESGFKSNPVLSSDYNPFGESFYGSRVRAFHPFQVDANTTRVETVLYFMDNSLSESDQDESISDAIIGQESPTELGNLDPLSVEVINIGSCPENETILPYPLTWPETQVGQMAESVEKCPDYSGKVGPRATRQCEGDLVSVPQWQEIIINDCFDDEKETNEQLLKLSQNKVTNENVTQVASDLAEVTNHTQNINATGLVAVAQTLELIVDVEPASPEVTSSVVETIDNILNIDDEEFREAVGDNAPTRILQSLEEQLTSLQKQGVNFTESRDNIEVRAVQVPQTSLIDGLGFASIPRNTSSDGYGQIFSDPNEIPVDETDASIVLPSEVVVRFREAVDDSAMVPVSFILYQNSKLFQSQRLEDESTSDIMRIVGTRVIFATVEGLEINDLPSEQPVVSTFLHTEVENVNNTLENFQCVFWDFDLANGRGDWSNEGCRLVESTEGDRSICHCDHLTSFAVLIDVYGQRYARLALDIFSQIGCGISITALIITLVTYLAVKSLRNKTPKRILICLSFTLLCLYIVFVVGIDRTDSHSGCIAVAALLHYLTLASVSWMGVEAINLYLLLVQVFNANVSRFMLKASLAAWAGPLIPVIIVLAVDTSQYVNVHHCFMQPSYAFYFADLLIIFLILVFNVVIFIMIIQKLTCGRKNLGRASDGDRKESLTRAVNAIAISVILGLTWIFAFLTIIENEASSLAFQVLFCVFNSLQGFFIFLLFCVRQKEVRNVWKKWFACGKSSKGSDHSSTGNSRGTSTTPKLTAFSKVSKEPESIELNSKHDDGKSTGDKH